MSDKHVKLVEELKKVDMDPVAYTFEEHPTALVVKCPDWRPLTPPLLESIENLPGVHRVEGTAWDERGVIMIHLC
ncbi:hypothetical protein [Saccharopolyspora griseoalba]|uniref:Uncharacterized protein n=1 Tax=Saccharopolyspora griseoalba TaxID=1431848 RepID=A0ABW2LSK3_9PSEU